ncbi:hypothetical protein NEOLI_003632 [Neolecta irregularis DAH-3]|uniref:Uncharacterized protein n=1 Tax=Neolecta irregularis (strain DAH-3) TaxID=1198029 RepID=A0A1U7LI24_NEOID|nr:hypothetical protein NEOLI_003632 [Neolecta irregularis DAH-3]|eukprot:OLL22278.1 hypothetical protein NEOLI_003632 [Neolecta irregularis DAH-3]
MQPGSMVHLHYNIDALSLTPERKNVNTNGPKLATPRAQLLSGLRTAKSSGLPSISQVLRTPEVDTPDLTYNITPPSSVTSPRLRADNTPTKGLVSRPRPLDLSKAASVDNYPLTATLPPKTARCLGFNSPRLPNYNTSQSPRQIPDPRLIASLQQTQQIAAANLYMAQQQAMAAQQQHYGYSGLVTPPHSPAFAPSSAMTNPISVYNPTTGQYMIYYAQPSPVPSYERPQPIPLPQTPRSVSPPRTNHRTRVSSPGFGLGISLSKGGHPCRQPFGPPPIDELVAALNTLENKNFATRVRRQAVNRLVQAGMDRQRGSANSSPTLSILSSLEETKKYAEKRKSALF